MIKEDRHKIQPFIDWVIDNKTGVNLGDLNDYMEEYLIWLKKGKEEVAKNNVSEPLCRHCEASLEDGYCYNCWGIQ